MNHIGPYRWYIHRLCFCRTHKRVYTRLGDITVYDGIWLFMTVYDVPGKYIQVYTIMNGAYGCLWTVNQGIFCFLLHPPGWPAWVLNICCCHCSVTRHTSSSTMVFTFLVLLPPPRQPLSWEGWGSWQGRLWAGLLPTLHCSCTCWILHPADIPVMLQWCSSSNWITKYPA
jgi:hypothetical protein